MDEVLLRHHYVLADGPGSMFTKESKALAQRMLTRLARAAAIAGDPRIDHDTITRHDSRDIRTRLGSDSCSICTKHVGKRERKAREPAERPEIEVVQGGGLEPNQHLTTVADARARDLGNLELREITVTARDQRSHPRRR
jgi:hypothetical protein